MIRFIRTSKNEDLAAAFAQPADDGALRLWWLGQAGFGFKYKDNLLLVDPYLSDSLEEKYKDRELKRPVGGAHYDATTAKGSRDTYRASCKLPGIAGLGLYETREQAKERVEQAVTAWLNKVPNA